MFDKNGGLQALIQYPGKFLNLPSLFLIICLIINSILLRHTTLSRHLSCLIDVAMVPLVADVQTAVVAKEALEGHCIYDGGFCKLHISYSRHTDLSIKVD